MARRLSPKFRAATLRWLSVLIALAVIVAFIYGLSKTLIGPYGTPVVGGIIGLLTFLFTKTIEAQKQRETAIAEKKREVYKRLLAPWIAMLVQIKAGKAGDDMLATVNFEELYASSFDAALYGSEDVVRRYVAFRSPEKQPDPMYMLRSMAALILAMRQDVTGQKSKLSEEVVLRTFVNLKPEELVILRLREYVAKNPEAQKKVAELMAQSRQLVKSDSSVESKGKAG